MPINSEYKRDGIPFLVPDIAQKDTYLSYLDEIDQNQWYSNFGPLLQRFESELASVFFHDKDVRQRCVTCSSGTGAIELALLALGLKKGARVLLPSFTFAATASAVIHSGFEPVFLDVDHQSWLLTPEIAERAICHTAVDAIIPVCALGMPQDRIGWETFTQKFNIPIVMDAAAALGGQEVSESYFTCFSLHATKPFGVIEGGLVVTPNDIMAEKIVRLSNYGFHRGVINHAGGNYKLSEINAAIGLAQLARLPELRKRRAELQGFYHKHLGMLSRSFDVQQRAKLNTLEQEVITLATGPFMAAAAIVAKPEMGMLGEDICSMLNQHGIGSRRWYAPALHQHPAFSTYSTIGFDGSRSLPVSDRLSKYMVGLPFHNFLKREDIDYIVGTVMDLAWGVSGGAKVNV